MRLSVGVLTLSGSTASRSAIRCHMTGSSRSRRRARSQLAPPQRTDRTGVESGTVVTYRLLHFMFEVREYVDTRGRSPFTRWFDRLDARAAARVATALFRMEQGNLSNAKGVGAGVFEYRVDAGPGFRIYFGKDVDSLIILLGSGTKGRQQRDIEAARNS